MHDDASPFLRRLPPVTLAEDLSDAPGRGSRELSYLARWPSSSGRAAGTAADPTPRDRSLRTP